MEIKKTTSYKVTFSVESFTQTEGGMDHNEFGKPVNTLEEAIHLLELAEATQPAGDYQANWIITVDVQREIKGNKS